MQKITCQSFSTEINTNLLLRVKKKKKKKSLQHGNNAYPVEVNEKLSAVFPIPYRQVPQE